jgi:hypothetical protein
MNLYRVWLESEIKDFKSLVLLYPNDLKLRQHLSALEHSLLKAGKN